jgi:hypothetical protein
MYSRHFLRQLTDPAKKALEGIRGSSMIHNHDTSNMKNNEYD